MIFIHYKALRNNLASREIEINRLLLLQLSEETGMLKGSFHNQLLLSSLQPLLCINSNLIVKYIFFNSSFFTQCICGVCHKRYTMLTQLSGFVMLQIIY